MCRYQSGFDVGLMLTNVSVSISQGLIDGVNLTYQYQSGFDCWCKVDKCASTSHGMIVGVRLKFAQFQCSRISKRNKYIIYYISTYYIYSRNNKTNLQEYLSTECLIFCLFVWSCSCCISCCFVFFLLFCFLKNWLYDWHCCSV